LIFVLIIGVLKLYFNFQAFDNTDDFSINRVNKRIGDSSKSLVSNSETALMREVHEEEQTNKILNNELIPDNRIYSEDDKEKDNTYILGKFSKMFIYSLKNNSIFNY
jgi:hypothetical protein